MECMVPRDLYSLVVKYVNKTAIVIKGLVCKVFIFADTGSIKHFCANDKTGLCE